MNNRPALRIGDTGIHAPCCGANSWVALVGAPTVFINGRAAFRMNDIGQSCGAVVKLIEGSLNVVIGNSGSAGGGAGGGGGGASPRLVIHSATRAAADAAARAAAAAEAAAAPAPSPPRAAPRPALAESSTVPFDDPLPAPREDEPAPIDDEPELAWVEIEVLDWDGKPLANEPVTIELPDGSLREERLDSQGRVRLDDVPPGSCRVRMPDRDEDSWLPPPPIARPDTTGWIGLEFSEENGAPLAGEPVRVVLPDGTVREAKLDEHGRLRLEGIPLGPCTVSLPERDEDAFLPPPPRPSAGPRTAWLELELLDEHGAPVADEPLEIVLPDGTEREVRLDARGRVRLDGIPPGSCTVRLPERDEDAFAPPPAAPAPAATGDDWLELAVVEEDGRPVAGEACRIRLPDGAVREVTTDAAGRVRLEGIPHGICHVALTGLDEDGITRGGDPVAPEE